MNSLDFLDIANVNTQVGTLPYVLPEEKKAKHKLVGSFRVDQFRGNIRIDMPLNFLFVVPNIPIEELNLSEDIVLYVNQWPFYKGGRVWPPVTTTEEPTTEEPVVEPVVEPTEPVVDPVTP